MVRGQILEVRRKVNTGLVTACHGPECNDAYQADMMQTTSAMPLMPNDFSSRLQKILWSTVSNAAVMSSTARTDWFAKCCCLSAVKPAAQLRQL